jgi:alpha-galactosidase
MRFFRFVSCFALLLSVELLFAVDISGNWRAARIANGGVRIYDYFRFAQQGEKLSGQLRLGWGDLDIHDGRVVGDRVSFEAGDHWSYQGKLTGSVLLLTYRDANNPPVVLQLSQEGAEEGLAPKPLPLPALRQLAPNGLAPTPPMGWNSWNYFAQGISDAVVRQTADAMVANGMRDAGYVYLNIDEAWEGDRDSTGNIHSNAKFPDMKALADYVHSRGLKLGIYSSPGPQTCDGYRGSYGYEAQDAAAFAAWGIDYLKYDWCSAFRIYQPVDMRAVYQKMGEALQKTGRPIVYSLCQYGKADVWTWGAAVGGNLWRTTTDIGANFKSMHSQALQQEKTAAYAGSGHWNDPDMLEVGNPGLSDDESRTHFSLWALLAAPLIAGNDLLHMNTETREILLNREVIAIDQDPLSQQARLVFQRDDVEIWAKQLSGGRSALGFLNTGGNAIDRQISWTSAGVQRPNRARDVWKHQDVPVAESGLQLVLRPHAMLLLVISGDEGAVGIPDTD